MKFETRDLIALVALGLISLAMGLEACGHPVAEWLRTPLSTVVSVVLGFYFVDSAKKAASAAQAKGAQTPPAPTEPGA